MNLQNLLQIDLILQISGITPGRAATILPAMLGLLSITIGWLAHSRLGIRYGSRRIKAIVALVAGLIGIVLSGIHLAQASGAFGTGSGRLGAIVALVLGIIGIALSGRILARNPQNDKRNNA
jgi:Family of unknown function (DUF6223)